MHLYLVVLLLKVKVLVLQLCSTLCNRPVVSDSLRPSGLWPTRLFCPRNPSGKNTGGGSVQFSSFAPSCPTLSDPVDYITPLPCPSPAPGPCPHSCPSSSVMPSNHLICHPLLLLPSVFPSIRGFSDESVLRIRSPEY